MQKTPGIYVEIRGNSSQLREELKKVKAETDQLSQDVSKALNKMFTPADVRKAVDSLANDLSRVQTLAKSASNDVFKGQSEAVDKFAKAINMAGKEYLDLQNKMMSNKAATSQEAALNRVAKAAGLTTREIQELGKQLGLTNKSAEALLQSGIKTGLDSIALSLDKLKAASTGAGLAAVSTDLAGAAKAANLTEQEFKQLQDQLVKVANTKALESSFQSIATAAGMSAAQIDAFGTKMGVSAKSISSVKAALGLLPPEIVSVGNALKSGLQSKFEEVAVSIERLKAVSKSDFFAGVSSRLQEVAVAANLTEQEFKELHAQITSVSATKTAESSLKAIASAAGMTAAQIDAFGIKLGASVANIHAVKAALGLLPPEIQTLEQALRSKMQASLDSVANSLNTLRASAKGGSFGALSADLKSAASAANLTEKEFKELQDQIIKTANTKALESSLKSIATAAGMSAAQIDAFGTKMGASVKNIENVKTALGQMKPKTEESAGALSMLGVALGSAFGSLAGQAIGSTSQRVIEFAKSVIDAGLAMDSLNMSYSAIFGGQTNAAREMGYVSETADRLGQSFLKLADSYRLYSAAAKGTSMSSKELKDGFESITAASTTLGLSTERTELVFKAFTQIMSKGQVMMEEVKNQLGDSLPGALDLFARSLGVSKSQFMELAKEGKLLSDDVLPKVFAEMKRTYEQAAETAALETGRAAVNRLASEWDKFKISLFDTKAFIVASNGIALLIKAARSAAGAIDIKDKLIAAQRELASYESGLGEGLPFYESGLKKAREEVIKLKEELRQLEDPATDSFQALADGAAKAESRSAAYLSKVKEVDEEVRKSNQTERDKLDELYNERKLWTTDRVGLEKWYNAEVAKLQAAEDKRKEASLKKTATAENKAENARKRAIEAYYNYIGNQESASSANRVSNIQADRDKLLDQMAKNLSSHKDYEAMRQQIIAESARRVTAIADEEAAKREAAIDAYYDYVGSKAAGSDQNQIERERRKVDAVIDGLRQELGETEEFLKLKDALLKAYDKKATDIVEKGEKERSKIREEMEDEIFDAYATDLQKQARALDKYLKEQKKAYMEANASLIADGKKTTEEVASEFDNLAVRYREAMEYANDPTIKAFKAAWDSAIERLDDAFLDLWDSFLEGGESTFDAFKSMFKSMLAELAHAAITKPIVLQIGTSMSNMLYGQGSPTEGQGGFNMPTNGLSNLIPDSWKAGASGITNYTLPGTVGMAGAYTGAYSAVGAAPSMYATGMGFTSGQVANGALSGTSFAAGAAPMASGGMTLGTAAGYGGWGGLGYSLLGGAVGLPQSEYSGLTASAGGMLGAWGASALASAAGGAAAGAAAGSVVPVIGTAIGAIIGGLAGSLIGGEEQSPSVIFQEQLNEWGQKADFEFHTKDGADDEWGNAISEQLGEMFDASYQTVESMLDALGEGYVEQLEGAVVEWGRNKSGDGVWKEWDFGADMDMDELLGKAMADIQDSVLDAAQSIFEQAGQDIISSESAANALAMLGEESGAALQEMYDTIAAGVQNGDVLTYANQLALLNQTIGGIEATWEAVNAAVDDLMDPPSEYEQAVRDANAQFDTWVGTLEAVGIAEDRVAEIEAKRSEYLEDLAVEYGEHESAMQEQIDAHADLISARDAEIEAMAEQAAALEELAESLATQAADALKAGDGVEYVNIKMQELANGLIEGQTMPTWSTDASTFNYQYGMTLLPFMKEAAESISASALSIANFSDAYAATVQTVNREELARGAAFANAEYFAEAIGSSEVTSALAKAFGAAISLDYQRYAPNGSGVSSIYAAQEKLQYVATYDYSSGQYGVDVAAYIDATEELNDKLDEGAISADVFAEAMEQINKQLPDAVDLLGDLDAQLERIAAAQSAVGQAGLDSVSYYFGELAGIVRSLSEAAEEAATPLGELENAIGMLNSASDAFSISASAAMQSSYIQGLREEALASYDVDEVNSRLQEATGGKVKWWAGSGYKYASGTSFSEQKELSTIANEIMLAYAQELQDQALNGTSVGKAQIVADAAAEAAAILTTQSAKEIADELATLPDFASLLPEELRDVSLLLDGIGQYDSEAFLSAFYRISDALADGTLSAEQYSTMFDLAVDVFQNGMEQAADALDPQVLADTWAEILQASNDLVNPLSEMEQEMRSINDQYDEWIASLTELGATQEQLATIEGHRADVLANLSQAYAIADAEAAVEVARQNLEVAFEAESQALMDIINAHAERLQNTEQALMDAYNSEVTRLGDIVNEYETRVSDARSDLTTAYNEEAAALQNTADRFTFLAKQLDDWIDAFWSGSQSPLNMQDRTALLYDNFRTALEGALTGDESSFEDLTGAATSYLELARANAATREDYARISGSIATQMEQASGVAESQSSVAEQQLAALNAQVAGIEGLNEAALTFERAFAEYQYAMADTSAQDAKTQLNQLETQMESLGLLNKQVDYQAALVEYQSATADTAAEAAQAQLDAMQKEYDAIMGVNTSVMSVRDAINALQAAMGSLSSLTGQTQQPGTTTQQPGTSTGQTSIRDVLVNMSVQNNGMLSYAGGAVGTNFLQGASEAVISQIASLAGVPGYATGGAFGGGLRIVGENGPELEYTGPSRIWNATDTRDILTGGSSQSELVAEIQQLRAEIRAANGAIARNTQDTAKLMRRWDGDGMPDTRAA